MTNVLENLKKLEARIDAVRGDK